MRRNKIVRTSSGRPAAWASALRGGREVTVTGAVNTTQVSAAATRARTAGLKGATLIASRSASISATLAVAAALRPKRPRKPMLAKHIVACNDGVCLLTGDGRDSHLQARTFSSGTAMAPFRSARSISKLGNNSARKQSAAVDDTPAAADRARTLAATLHTARLSHPHTYPAHHLMLMGSALAKNGRPCTG